MPELVSQRSATSMDTAALLNECGVSVAFNNHQGHQIQIQVQFRRSLPPLAKAIITDRVFSFFDMAHRTVGGSGLQVLDSLVTPGTGYILRGLVDDYQVSLATGLREASLKAKHARIVYVDYASPYAQALAKTHNTLLTKLDGVCIEHSVNVPAATGASILFEHSVLPVVMPKSRSKLERIRLGALLRHEIAHLYGAGELQARLKEREYLRKLGLKGPTDKQIFLQLAAVNIISTLFRRPKYQLSDLIEASNYAWKESRSVISKERLALRAIKVLFSQGWYRLGRERQNG